MPLAAIISEISSVFPFSYIKAYITKFDLPVKRSRSLRSHHLKKLLSAEIPKCNIPSFVKIGPPVPGMEYFSRVFTIYGHCGHLGHVTSIISQIFISMNLKAYIQNLIEKGPS